MASSKSQNLVWVDLEMTGLDPEKDHILEAACIVTDASLEPIGEGIEVIIHQEDAVLDGMSDWCKEHHGKSGLTDAVRKSSVSLQQAERTLLDYVTQHTVKGRCPLAGNTVHMDRVFLMRHMPRLLDSLHYRIVDVSTMKELSRRWNPRVLTAGEAVKRVSHRALDDVRDSIAELRVYRDQFVRTDNRQL